MTTHAVIGTGYWGTNHVRVGAELMESDVFDDLLLCDVAEDRVSELAASYGVDYVTDHAELAEQGADTAVVATPSTTHQPIATDLLKAGIDCLVEKPLALDAASAWDIVDTAEREGQTLGVGHIFRYHPALQELKRRVDRGELGQIKYLTTNRYAFREPRDTTGVLYSLAVHDVDIYSYLMGTLPEAVYCRLDRHIRSDIDETATLIMEYGNATGVINESWQVPVFGKKRDLVVVGTEGAAYVDYLADTKLELFDAKVVKMDGTLRARDGGGITHEVAGHEPLKMEVEAFIEAVNGEEDPPASGHVGAKAVELLELAERSDEANQTIQL